MPAERRYARRFSQIWENAKDMLSRHKQEAPERSEKTMVEKVRPAPVLQPKGPGAQAVNRRAHYRQVRAENARESAKHRHLRPGRETDQAPKFDRKQKNQIRSTFNRKGKEQSRERDR